MIRYPSFLRAASLWAALALGSLPAGAQETDMGAHLMIELNAAESLAEGCKLSFLAFNGHPADIDDVTFEAVLFDAAGQVDQLTLLGFGALPAARPRVRQFVIPGMACDAIGQVLFNGTSVCASASLAPGACTNDLELSSKTDIEVTG
ncbi:hypothetical protein SAMN05421666_1623 [Roseovarius nanhaiticus]|uniref:Uncharacterized protein n=1 Tax=Roseovarius nanhaiticus TaxID=573024 RepID=A0A1N7G322_9RHOB|nr:hypothetical protein [Roseovarius nanhaiticus]SEK38547.1 hypothetical protein SAMN05216208_0513 [Roseovarius nanhaiticus]SIS07030.1 hypothetical protein SAMN05421666_1623 [Roseovarius nanhaiticus]